MALSTPASVLQLSGSATREIDYRKLPHSQAGVRGLSLAGEIGDDCPQAPQLPRK